MDEVIMLLETELCDGLNICSRCRPVHEIMLG